MYTVSMLLTSSSSPIKPRRRKKRALLEITKGREKTAAMFTSGD
jgi:hypothetical protein